MNFSLTNFQGSEKPREKSHCIESSKEKSAVGIGYMQVTCDRMVLSVGEALMKRSERGTREKERGERKGRERERETGKCVSLALAILSHYSSNLFSEEASHVFAI